jgi:hypothetical protein
MTVYYRSVDHADNWEAPKSISFKVDTVAPGHPQVSVVDCRALNGIAQPWCDDPNFTWSQAVENGSGIPGSNSYQVYWGTDKNGTSTSYNQNFQLNPSAIPAKTPYYLRMRVVDNNGNWSEWKTLYTMIYDPEAKVSQMFLPLVGTGFSFR